MFVNRSGCTCTVPARCTYKWLLRHIVGDKKKINYNDRIFQTTHYGGWVFENSRIYTYLSDQRVKSNTRSSGYLHRCKLQRQAKESERNWHEVNSYSSITATGLFCTKTRTHAHHKTGTSCVGVYAYATHAHGLCIWWVLIRVTRRLWIAIAIALLHKNCEILNCIRYLMVAIVFILATL